MGKTRLFDIRRIYFNPLLSFRAAKKINCKNWILFLKPTKEATAPSNEPCGRPMKKINKNEIIFKIVRSANILFK